MAKKKSTKPKVGTEVFWNPDCRITDKTAPADKAYAEVQKIMQANGTEEVTAEEYLVYAASHKRSLAYKLIGDWDDTSAARKWRLDQARNVLRSFHIVYKDAPEKPTRALNIDYASFRPQGTPRGYRDTRDLLLNDEAREGLLARALAELQAFERRYSRLTELAEVFESISKLIKPKRPPKRPPGKKKKKKRR